MLGSLGQDLRFALRQFRKAPAFVAVVVTIVALGIAASTAIFSVVDGVLLRPLPYPHSDRLVRLWEATANGSLINVADANFRDIEARSHSFSALAEMNDLGEEAVSGGARPERAQLSYVSSDFFRVLDVRAFQGRTFLPAEQRAGGTPVAVVSYGFWQRAFGGGAGVLGATLHIEGRSYTIVGVMPANVDQPVGAEIWLPRGQFHHWPSRSAHNWAVIGRLANGVSVAQARRDVRSIMKSLKQQYGDQVDTGDGALRTLREAMVGGTRPILLVLLAASLVLLLIACTNAVNLLVARMASRKNEVAVRTALGAGRVRLARQFLTETTVLSLAGAVFGVVLARIGVAGLLSLQSGRLPRAADISLDWAVLGFAVLLAVAVGIAMALVAVWRGTRGDVRDALAEAQRSQSGPGSSYRLRGGLIVVQFAMTLAMLVAAGLLARSFERLLSVEPGFATSHAVVLDLPAPSGEDSTALAARVHLGDALTSRLAAIPGVTRVGLVNSMPLAPNGGGNGTFLILSSPNDALDPSHLETLFRTPGRTGHAEYRIAGPGYFAAMHIPLLQGRRFDDRDTQDAPHAAIISQSLADEKWKGENPLGRFIEFGNMDGDRRPFTVVGVVGDVRERGLAAQPRPTLYGDYRQRPQTAHTINVVMATSGSETPVITAARRVAREVAPDAPGRVRSIESIVSTSLTDRRFSLVLVGTFAAAALLLATLGIYGVVSYLVAERRRELAIRLALGATAAELLWMVLGEGARLAAAGMVAGAVLSFAGLRVLRTFLYHVSPTDPAAFLAVALVLACIGLVACWIPARRAGRVEPSEALRG